MLIAEFLEISRAVAIGVLVMGFIGFAVKLMHIPINNILVSSSESRRLMTGWPSLRSFLGLSIRYEAPSWRITCVKVCCGYIE